MAVRLHFCFGQTLDTWPPKYLQGYKVYYAYVCTYVYRYMHGPYQDLYFWGCISKKGWPVSFLSKSSRPTLTLNQRFSRSTVFSISVNWDKTKILLRRSLLQQPVFQIAGLRWAWTFHRSSPSPAGSSWFPCKCMSACKIDIPKRSIFMPRVAVLRSKMFRIIFIGQTQALKSWGSSRLQALPA